MIEIPSGKIIIWVVKASTIILSILMLMFMFGEGFPAFAEMSPRQTILFVAFFCIFIGLNFIWWKPRVAAWTLIGSSTAFWLIEVIYNSSFWIHWFFLFFPLTAILIFLSEKYTVLKIGKPKRRKRKTKRK